MGHRVLLRSPANSIPAPAFARLARVTATRTPGAASAAACAELVRSARR